MPADIGAQKVDYEAVVADLEERLVSLETERTAIKSVLDGVRQLLRLDGRGEQTALPLKPLATSPEKPPPSVATSEESFADLPIAEAAEKYLRKVGHPQTNRELVNGLVQEGLKTKSPKIANVVRTTLRVKKEKHGTFTYIDHKWGLPEWGNKQPPH